jgi:transcriptional regulator with XRE-family HTH domain
LRRHLGYRIIPSVETNFFIFRERLAIACRLRGITYEQLCSSIGLGGGRRTVDLEHAGLRALDIYRLAQIADRLDVSIDWLLGRSKAMELRETQCQGEIG